MLFRLASVVAAAAVLFTASPASAAPTSSASLPDSQNPGYGYPDPDAAQLADIEVQADGTLPNAPPPAKLNNNSLPVFQLIAFNEFFEVAFFTSLLNNVTQRVDGFALDVHVEQAVLEQVLTVVRAQEELHALNAVDVLEHFGATLVPAPCVYTFPTTDVGAALALAETFTSVVLGTLQDAAQALAVNGDDGPVRAVASVIGQEGEQNGFYRSLLKLVPSEKPFLTTSIAAYAFSALQQFIVSCPFDVADIPIPIFPPLDILSGRALGGAARVSPSDQELAFSANLSGVASAADLVRSGLFVTYLSGQDLPISEPITKASWSGDILSFEAFFPFDEFIMDGLTIAALTTGGNFSSPDDLPAQTLAAPGFIQVDVSLE